MSSTPGVLELPKRLSLSAQAADSLRKAIAGNVWSDFLPSERRLCDLLKVSRPTVRSALNALAQERVIEIRHGRRIRLISPSKTSPAPHSRLVVLVSHFPLAQTTLTAFQGISEMRTHLAEHGFNTEVLVCPPRKSSVQCRKLERFIQQNRVFCCVLLSVSREVQAWFAHHSIPALVLGSCHADVKLPSLDVDYRAVCRHAVGVLRSKGHRRLAFIVPDSGAAGDLVSEEGFREGTVARPGSPGVEATVVRHPDGPANLGPRLDALLGSSNPPTALLVAKPAHTLAVILHLLRRGIKVPDTVSLIARDHDPLFENGLSHYSFQVDSFAQRLSRLMLQMVGQGYLPPEPNLIFPRFISGGTVKTKPASP